MIFVRAAVFFAQLSLLSLAVILPEVGRHLLSSSEKTNIFYSRYNKHITKVMIAVQLILVSYLLLCNGVSSQPLWNILHDLVQWNIAGIPTIHEKSTWNFDPKAGKNKQAAYEELNGKLGSYEIARLGLSSEHVN